MSKANMTLSIEIREGRVHNHQQSGEDWRVTNEVSRVAIEAVEKLIAAYRPIKVEPPEVATVEVCANTEPVNNGTTGFVNLTDYGEEYVEY